MKSGALKHYAAFTLLEIMVALALVSVIILAVYSSWFSIIKGSAAAARTAAAAQHSRIIMREIEDSLLCACMYSQNGRYYPFLVDSSGDFTSISFVAHLPKSFLRSGKFDGADIRRVTFSVDEGPDSKKQLVLRQNILLMDPDQDEMRNPLVLAHNVTQFLVEFIDPKNGDWTSEWVLTNQLPTKVRITLTTGSKDTSGDPPEQMVGTVSMISTAIRPEWQMPVGGLTGAPLNTNAAPGTQQFQQGTQPGGQRGNQPGSFGAGGIRPLQLQSGGPP